MKRAFNQLLGLIALALQSIRAALGGNLAIAVGVLVATVTICSILLYADAVNLAVLRDRLTTAHAENTFDLIVQGSDRQMDAAAYAAMDDLITGQMRDQVGLPLQRVSRHGWTKALSLLASGAAPDAGYNELPRMRLQFYSELDQAVEVVEGALAQPVTDPQGTVEVMASRALANELGLRVGDLFLLQDFVGGSQPMQVRGRLAGLIAPRTDAARAVIYAPRFLDEALTAPAATFFAAVAPAITPSDTEVNWAANYDVAALNVETVNRALAGVDLLQFTLKSRLQNLQFLTNLDNALTDYVASTFQLKALLTVLGAPVIAIALYYILLSAGLLVQQRQGEIAVIKSRGGSDGQVMALFLVQGLVIVTLSTLVAPLLAVPIAQLIGKAATFMDFSGDRLLPATLQPNLYLYAGLAALLALFAILAPAWQAARQTIVTYRRSAARENRRMFVHRFFLDVVLVLLGALGYWQLDRSGAIIARSPTGGLEFDPLLLLTPILLVAGLTFVALRFVPLVVRGLAALIGLSDSVASLFGLRQVARSPARYNGLILILVFTLAIGLFTAAIANAFDRNYSDQALYAAGADLRTHEFDYDTASWKVRPLADYLALPGVVDGAAAARIKLIGRQAQVPAKGTLLAIDPAALERVAWWRADFAPDGSGAPLAQVLAPLATRADAVLADRDFIRRYRLTPGETFDIDIDGQRVDFTLAGEIGYFPSLLPTEGDRLIANLAYLQTARGIGANEVWLATDPGAHKEARAALRSTAGRNLLVVDDGQELAGVRKEDPVRTGLFGALSLGFIAASLLSVLGFLLYAYLTIQARALQFGVLRATGLSTGQLIAALATEQLTLIGAGVVLGTALGGAAGWMFTRFLQVSVIAREAVPPFLVEMPWAAVIRLYLVLIVIFGAALLVSVYLLRRMRISAVLRLGEQA